MKQAWFCAALVAGACATFPAMAAEKAAVELAPASEWTLRKTAENCRLTRTFGEGKDAALLRLDRFEPGGKLGVLVAGGILASTDRSRTKARFGPGGRADIGGFSGGSVGDYKPGVYTSVSALTTGGGDPAAIAWLEIARKGQAPVRLALGSMGTPMAALDKCSDELLAGWGFDLAAHRRLTRPVTPIGNPGRWLSPNDYPREMSAMGAQGTVNFRLSVDRAGAVTRCQVQQETQPAGFGEAACERLMRTAKFEPALGADGAPMESYYVTTARFQMMRF